MNKSKKKLRIEEKIDRYVDGELTQDEIDDLWVEIMQDEEHLNYLKTAANLQELAKQGESKNSGENRNTVLYAAAAVIILLVAILGAMHLGYFSSSPGIQPVKKLELGYTRSPQSPANISNHQKIIRHALQLYKKQKFGKAVGFLESKLDKAKDADWIAKLNITIGTLYYNNDEFNEAAYYFSNVVNYKSKIQKAELEKAYWYLGNAYFQLSMNDEAAKAMRKAYKLNGAYSRVAKSYLEAMASAKKK